MAAGLVGAESGWRTANTKSFQDAAIPVILTDRAVDSRDKSLYVRFLGSDFVKEGQKAGEWAVAEFGDTPTDVVELAGTTGAAPAIDGKAGPGAGEAAGKVPGKDIKIVIGALLLVFVVLPRVLLIRGRPGP